MTIRSETIDSAIARLQRELDELQDTIDNLSARKPRARAALLEQLEAVADMIKAIRNLRAQ